MHYHAMRLAMNFTAREIAVAVEGELIGDGGRAFTEVAIDSAACVRVVSSPRSPALAPTDTSSSAPRSRPAPPARS